MYILLPCSQLKGNRVVFCQSHPSIPHFTHHRSPLSIHNTRAVLLQPSAPFCHDERSLQLVLKASIFPLMFLVKIHVVQEITCLLFLPFQSLLKYGPRGIGCCFLLHWPGNFWAENSTYVRASKNSSVRRCVGVPYFAMYFVWLGSISCY